jgi:hypothetical protein
MWAGSPYEHIMMPVAGGAAATTVAQPTALRATGGAAVPWLAAALALAGLGLMGGGWLLARRGLS